MNPELCELCNREPVALKAMRTAFELRDVCRACFNRYGPRPRYRVDLKALKGPGREEPTGPTETPKRSVTECLK
jgi:ribosome-binding protein aMBF1 (putative translation factor)